MSSDSDSTRSKLRLVVLGTRAAGSPLTAVSGTPASTPCSSRSRSAAIRGAASAAAWRAYCAAAPMPEIAGTFSVPARRFRSCRPPVTKAASRTPRRTHKAPVPLGPPNL